MIACWFDVDLIGFRLPADRLLIGWWLPADLLLIWSAFDCLLIICWLAVDCLLICSWSDRLSLACWSLIYLNTNCGKWALLGYGWISATWEYRVPKGYERISVTWKLRRKMSPTGVWKDISHLIIEKKIKPHEARGGFSAIWELGWNLHTLEGWLARTLEG